MLNVRCCIEERRNYPLRKSTDDDWVTYLNTTEIKDDVFFVVPEGFLFSIRHKQREELEKRYHIAGVFDLGTPYVNIGVHMTLVYAVPHEVDSLKVGIYKDIVYRKKGNVSYEKYMLTLPEEYLEKFNIYTKQIEEWINNGIVPEDDKNETYEYNEIPIDEVDNASRYPRYYSKQAITIRNLLRKENTVELLDVADIVTPKEDRNSTNQVKRLKMNNLHYPLELSEVTYSKPTSVTLQKGDIVFPLVGEVAPFLYNIDSDEKVYASPNMAIVKCKDIQPEYLFLYLNSETAICVLDSISTGTAIRRISIRGLSYLPIPLPTQDEQSYHDDFEVLTSSFERRYANRKGAYRERLEAIADNKQKADALEDILNVENIAKMKLHNEEQLKTFLMNDLKELNVCYKGKAYKAALILAGSILEAVLIDWLSEIKGVDFFENEYIITKRDGSTKRADLIDYINEIKYIERPNWMLEAEKAHEIRKKRNLVHAKLCLKTDEINEIVCKQVIEYLKDVLKTRGIK